MGARTGRGDPQRSSVSTVPNALLATGGFKRAKRAGTGRTAAVSRRAARGRRGCWHTASMGPRWIILDVTAFAALACYVQDTEIGAMRISPAQSRAARAFLQWSQAELEKQTGVCIRTIRNFEGEVRQPHEHTMAAICKAFESHGVEFLPQDRGGEGVQFKKAMADHRKEGRRHARSDDAALAPARRARRGGDADGVASTS